jgi:hypothetical protein
MALRVLLRIVNVLLLIMVEDVIKGVEFYEYILALFSLLGMKSRFSPSVS